ncbi:MAG: tetraacyldisaccharide 4'-kinase [Limnobacter sp.]|nr:tetraacyldisaccharide 4'-kinase [Limnobacter sp.]
MHRFARHVTGQTQKVLWAKKTCIPEVLVVGNLTVGGAGKTPIVLGVCEFARRFGKQVGIVSRGYGRSDTGAALLETGGTPDPALFGDEPVWLHQQTACPVAVGANRAEALALLLQHHPEVDLVVSDDGLQHHQLPRSMEWAVFDDRGAGNGHLLPAGPLREDLDRLESVNAVLASNLSVHELAHLLGRPAGDNWHEVEVSITGFRQHSTGQFLHAHEASQKWLGQRLLAFSGLGNPRKFFKGLEGLGLIPIETVPLPDHHHYPAGFCEGLHADVLLTTGKDAVKLPRYDLRLWVAEVHVSLPTSLEHTLRKALGLPTD